MVLSTLARLRLLLLTSVFEVSTKLFPIDEFVNTSSINGPLLNLHLCHSIDNITKSSQYNNLFSTAKCCSCEKNCVVFKNCCIDVFWDHSNPLPVNQYVGNLKRENTKYKDLSCKEVFPSAREYAHKSNYMWMVTGCLAGASQQHIDGCNNVHNGSYEYQLPVTGSDNYLYKNSHCARCNMVESFQLTDILLECEELMRSFDRFNNVKYFPKKCIFSIKIANLSLYTTKTCNLGSAECNLKSNISLCNKTADFHCFMCHHKEVVNCDEANQYYNLCRSFFKKIGKNEIDYHCWKCECKSTGKGDDLKWALTISFSSQTNVKIKSETLIKNKDHCRNGKMYNLLTDKCENTVCSHGYKSIGKSCKKMPVIFDTNLHAVNSSFERCLLKKSNSVIVVLKQNQSNINAIGEEFRKVVHSDENIKFVPVFQNSIYSYYSAEISISKTFSEFNFQLSIPDLSIWNVIQALYIVKDKLIITELHGFDIARAFSKERLCAATKKYNYNLTKITSTCSLLLNNSTIRNDNTTQWIRYSRHSADKLISTCDLFYHQSDCLLKHIVSNYTILKNKSLLFDNKLHTPSQYSPLAKGIGLCVKSFGENFKHYTWLKTIRHWESSLSFYGSILSVVCYIVILLLDICFNELQNLPALILFGLIGTLLTADSLFLVASQVSNYQLTCKVVGVFLHWALLTVQSWIIVMSCSILTSFGSTHVPVQRQNGKMFMKYCMFTFVTPSVMVAVLCLLNEYGIYNVGYGLKGFCFIYQYYPRIIFHVVPMALSIFFAIFCFIKSIVFITFLEVRTRRVLKQSRPHRFNLLVIAFKMMSVLGLIEIFGFVQIVNNKPTEQELILNTVFQLLYTICRSCRGIILLVINLCSKRKWLGFRNKFAKVFSTGSQFETSQEEMK